MSQRLLPAIMEGTLLALVCLAPWAYGAIHPGFEFLLLAGVGLLVGLWGLRILLEGLVTWKKCPVALCLGLFFLAGLWQITPLPRDLLSFLSPHTAQLYEELIPSEHERIVSDLRSLEDFGSLGSTISLYPTATRLALIRVLAVFLVFAFVRNNLEAPAVFRRLAIACVINGALLSLFALVQLFTSPPDVLYWSYSSMGRVFGPFTCRNHFPFYINMCIGLGLGLLMRDEKTEHLRQTSEVSKTSDLYRSLVHRPSSLAPRLWVCFALALMLAAVAFSLSRGGFLALIGGLSVCLLMPARRKMGLFGGGFALLSIVIATGLLAWFGIGKIQARWSSFLEGGAFQENRLPLWNTGLSLAKDFPIFGTGLGTYRYIDPLYRTGVEFAEYAVDHVHNDYLETFAEAGAIGLALVLLAMVLIYRFSLCALKLGHGPGGLVLGGLCAFTAFVLHSFVDFGAHIPAITLLASVICAHLCAAGSCAATPSSRIEIRWRGTPLLACGICLLLGLILASAGWRHHAAQALRQFALRAAEATGSSGLLEKKDLLEAAVRLAPSDAELRLDLGETLADLYRAKKKPTQLTAALSEFVRARDLCPVLPGPQLALALYSADIARAEQPEVYYARAQKLGPYDPALWYYCGTQELSHGMPRRAWESWRRCLELSDRYLPAILQRSALYADANSLIHDVLPPNPEMLLNAAWTLYPRPDAADERAPFLNEARSLLTHAPLTDGKLHTKAIVEKSLGNLEVAIPLYQKLVAGQPLNAAARFELAQVLYDAGRTEESRTELFTVLAQEPKHRQAKELLEKSRAKK